MLWIVDINREVDLTATKNTDRKYGDFLLCFPAEKHRHRKSIVPRIVRSWICPFKPGTTGRSFISSSLLELTGPKQEH